MQDHGVLTPADHASARAGVLLGAGVLLVEAVLLVDLAAAGASWSLVSG
jgi:hypothetical protein